MIFTTNLKGVYMENKIVTTAIPEKKYAATEFGRTQGRMEEDCELSGVHTPAEVKAWKKSGGKE
jgi:hypothetical protein